MLAFIRRPNWTIQLGVFFYWLKTLLKIIFLNFAQKENSMQEYSELDWFHRGKSQGFVSQINSHQDL